MALGRNLNALLDGGWVVASPDINARRDRQPRPSSLPPVIRDAMLGKLTAPLVVVAKSMGEAISVTVDGGNAPFTVTLDGGSSQTKSSRSFAFTGAGDGAHKVAVVDGSGRKASTAVSVVSPEAKKTNKKAE